MEKVYFIPIKELTEEKIKKVYSLLEKNLSESDVMVKLHFGEKGCETFIPPNLVKMITSNIKQNFVLSDANVLYKGSRTSTEEHIKTSKEHGFDFAPIEIADDKGELNIEVNLKHFKDIKVGKSLEKYKNIVVISHFKGHMATGFGGALKNLGMGLGTRAGKLAMHAGISPNIDADKCILCNKCLENCPVNAIETINNKNVINKEKCIGCAKCIAICPQGAVRIPWGAVGEKELQERIVEYCYGILKNRKIIYFNFLGNITRNCDCMGSRQEKVMEDIGLLASDNIVAIDQASLDLIKEKAGKNIFQEMSGVSGERQLEYAEELRIGSRKYELVKI